MSKGIANARFLPSLEMTDQELVEMTDQELVEMTGQVAVEMTEIVVQQLTVNGQLLGFQL